MKRFSALLLALVMALSLVACGKEEPAPAPAPAGDPAAATPAAPAAPAEATVDRDDYFITVLTGPTSGIYYPIGGAFQAALAAYGYPSSSTATGATVENINNILTDQGELAIAMSDSVLQAYGGWGAYEDKEPAENLRFMMSLWPNYVQIVTTADTGITKFEDLKGKRVGVGAPNSGVELNARMIFEAHGMTYEDCKVDYLSYGEAIEQMQNGQCDVAFVTSGLGNATISELGVTADVVLVPVEGDALKNLCNKYACYFEGTIPADTYGNPTDVTTAAVMNIMLVDEDLPNEVVADMMDCFFNDGLKTIQDSHVQAARNISLEQALTVTPIPLHPGAEQYYKDHGVL